MTAGSRWLSEAIPPVSLGQTFLIVSGTLRSIPRDLIVFGIWCKTDRLLEACDGRGSVLECDEKQSSPSLWMLQGYYPT